MDVDFTTSVFESRFLVAEYEAFLDQIEYVPGLAAHVKATYGPYSLVAEWNGAIGEATLTDDTGKEFSLTPGAWQIALAYQFDWNPSVLTIGTQGTYFAIGYSRSMDMAGVTQEIDGMDTRVGFVPEQRFLVTVGEWMLDGLRLAVEFSHSVDYSRDDGGTGRSANAVFAQLTYEW
jgi:hypothetical protein